jgi:hypothetical protein
LLFPVSSHLALCQSLVCWWRPASALAWRLRFCRERGAFQYSRATLHCMPLLFSMVSSPALWRGWGVVCSFTDKYFVLNTVSLGRYSDRLRAGRPRRPSSRPGRVKNYFFSTSSRPVLGPPSLLYNGYRGLLSPGVKLPDRETGRSPSSAKVMNTWICTPSSPYVFTA